MRSVLQELALALQLAEPELQVLQLRYVRQVGSVRELLALQN
jgi:hypothetical protein